MSVVGAWLVSCPAARRLPIGLLDDALDEVLAVDPIFLSTAEKQSALTDVARLEARLAAVRLRLLAASGDIAEVTGARSAAAWLADRTRDAHGTVRRAAALADALDARWRQVGDALAAGVVNPAQVRVIVEALDALPTDLGDDLRVKAEAYLVEKAEQFGPRELRRLGRGVLDHLAPEVADEAEYQRLVAEERRAHAATRLSFRPRGDGSPDIPARIPDLGDGHPRPGHPHPGPRCRRDVHRGPAGRSEPADTTPPTPGRDPSPAQRIRHHHRAHDPGWITHHHPNGQTTFTRRT